MNSLSFTRYLIVTICVICAAFFVDVVITVMRGEASLVLASQEERTAQNSHQPYLVKDINPEGDSNLILLKDFNNSLIFSALNPDDSIELWKSDGTLTGTLLISDVVAGGWPVNYRGIAKFKNRLYLDSGYLIWLSNGTHEGTSPLFPALYRAIEGMIATSDRLTFFTTDRGCTHYCWDNGLEIWVSDGTSGGTTNLGLISGAASGFNPFNLVQIDDVVYFSAYYGDQGVELWRSDGTLEGTHMVKDIVPGYNLGSYPFQLTVLDNTLFFAGNLHELWKSDGTITGTVYLTDIVPSGYGEISELEKSGKKVFIGGGDVGIGFGLWTSDGTDVGTVMIKQFEWAEIAHNLTDVFGTLFFTVGDSQHGIELWKSDGTEDGTVMVKDICAGTNDSNPKALTAIDGKLYFTADDGIHGYEPWVSDGTEQGTMLLSDIQAGEEGSDPSGFTYSNGKIFFSAWDSTHGRELWALDLNNFPRWFLPYVIHIPDK
jgi:ELWxxDGT repeat protein